MGVQVTNALEVPEREPSKAGSSSTDTACWVSSWRHSSEDSALMMINCIVSQGVRVGWSGSPRQGRAPTHTNLHVAGKQPRRVADVDGGGLFISRNHPNPHSRLADLEFRSNVFVFSIQKKPSENQIREGPRLGRDDCQERRAGASRTARR